MDKGCEKSCDKLRTFSIINVKNGSSDLKNEFAKSRAIRTCVPAWLRAHVLSCQRGLRANVPAYQCAKSVPTSYFYVPTCQLMCQRAIRRANVLIWRANKPKGVTIFQTFL